MQKIVDFLNDSEAKESLNIKDIAKFMGLSVRSIQRYVLDLEKLNIITRVSNGDVSLNDDYLKILEDIGYDNKQLRLDDFLLIKEYVDPVLGIEEHVMGILRKIKAPLLALPTIRDKLLRAHLKDLQLNGLVGEKVLYPNYSSNSYITTDILGIASRAKRAFIRLESYYFFYLACIASASWLVQIRKGQLVNDRGFMVKPDFRRIREHDLPLRELFTEFPGLERVSYRLVLHYLAQTTLYQLAIQALSTYGKEMEIFFRLGSLVPHGFYSAASDRDMSFKKLKFEFLRTFNDFTKLAKSTGVTVCGVNIEPRDNWFSKSVIKPLMARDNELNLRDHFVLNLIMEERDATCLIQREEKGKNLKNYEFYMKNQHVVSKYEFLNLSEKDPIEMQKRVAEVAYNTCHPFPFRFVRNHDHFDPPTRNKTQLIAPFVCHESSHSAEMQASKLEKFAKVAFKYAAEKLDGELYREGIRNSNL